MRSMISGARCCSSSAAPGTARNFRTPSRPSVAGQLTSAQSAPTIAAQSALRRTRVPPPRRATIGKVSFETATPTARKPQYSRLGCSPSATDPGTLVALRRRVVLPMRPFRSETPSPSGTPHPAALLLWFDRHRRALPWRAPAGVRPDPYRVWLSEIMLQQTTLATVGPYFDRFF